VTSACGSSPPKSTLEPATKKAARLPAIDFTSAFERDHPLVGKWWDVRASAFVTGNDVLERAITARFVFVGEKHDNPDHHAAQAAILRGMIEGGRRPAVAFEMIDVDRQPALDAALKATPGDADAIARAVEWDKSGWPPWPMYRPLFASALGANLPIVAANQPKAQTKALVKEGIDSLPAGEAARLHLEAPMRPEDERSLRAELVDAHCGMIPANSKYIDGMILAERARDATMALRMLETGATDGAVLIAGSGHTRADRGAPAVIRAQAKGTPAMISIAFVEVQRDVVDPAAYAPHWGATALPFDYVLFTPVVSEEDPCAEMKAPK
jgi:uncharacterized iron-regulated protein